MTTTIAPDTIHCRPLHSGIHNILGEYFVPPHAFDHACILDLFKPSHLMLSPS
jgi:hypothetical protein